MDTIIHGMRNVLRLLLVVLLLGASLMLVAAMVSLNSSAQQQSASVHIEGGLVPDRSRYVNACCIS